MGQKIYQENQNREEVGVQLQTKKMTTTMVPKDTNCRPSKLSGLKATVDGQRGTPIVQQYLAEKRAQFVRPSSLKAKTPLGLPQRPIDPRNEE